MRNQPSYDDMLDTVDSKYALVVLAAKRARQLNEGSPALVQGGSTKPVTVAMQELKKGLLEYSQPTLKA